MLRNVALPAVKWTARKSVWVSLFTFIGFIAVDLYDGAHTRMKARYTQVESTITPTLDKTESTITNACQALWTGIETNPAPTITAIVIFALTVIYHRVHGTNLKTSILATLTRTTPMLPAASEKPAVLLKAEREILMKHLLDREQELQTDVANLPSQIQDSFLKATTHESEAKTAESTATSKRNRANSSHSNHKHLVTKLDEAKADLAAVRLQLCRTDEYPGT